MQTILYRMEKHGTILKILGGTIMDFSGGSVLKSSPADAGDSSSIPGLGRSPGEGHGNLLQCSCLENPTDYSPQHHKDSDMTECTAGMQSTVGGKYEQECVYIYVYLNHLAVQQKLTQP